MLSRRIVRAALASVVPIAAMIVAPVSGAVASVPQQASSCATPWQTYGDGWIGQLESPEFSSVPGIDFTRTVQFRLLGGDFAQRINESCRPEKAAFGAAGEIRQKQCGNFRSCSFTDWSNLDDSTEKANFRFPDRSVGWDPFSQQFRSWPLPVTAP